MTDVERAKTTGDIKNFNKKIESKQLNVLEGKTYEEIESLLNNSYCGNKSENTEGGIISDPVDYLRSTVGKKKDSYKVVESKDCTWSTYYNMDEFRKEENNCTLTALTNVMGCFKNIGYNQIPDGKELYDLIEKRAKKLGYKSSKGLSVTKNNNLVIDTWRKGMDYPDGKGKNDYLWTKKTLISQIKKNRPYMFSLATGQYSDHTVAVLGYEVYKNTRTEKEYTFLKVADGWSYGLRYMSLSESYIGCQTTIVPPSKVE